MFFHAHNCKPTLSHSVYALLVRVLEPTWENKSKKWEYWFAWENTTLFAHITRILDSFQYLKSDISKFKSHYILYKSSFYLCPSLLLFYLYSFQVCCLLTPTVPSKQFKNLPPPFWFFFFIISMIFSTESQKSTDTIPWLGSYLIY